jgi:hypothetical protein
MSRLTDNDKNWGPFTLARWTKRFAITFSSGGGEDEEGTPNNLLLNGFGWVLRINLPRIIQPQRIKTKALGWSEADIARMGRDYYTIEHERRFGFALSNMGNGYDFIQVFYGPHTMDSSTDKSWCASLPWKQWDCVRHSFYEPDGKHFVTAEKGKWLEFHRKAEECPASYFGFEDYDGEMIVATCRIEEREWHRGENWFKWLKWFWPAKIRRSLDIKFSAEVGPEKGSWKGGTTGHGIEMLKGETPRQAFERYCSIDHERKGRTYRLRFIGDAAQKLTFAP